MPRTGTTTARRAVALSLAVIAATALLSPVNPASPTAAVATAASEQTLFTSAPSSLYSAAATSSKAVELGVRFSSVRDGYINGVRFYKVSGSLGPHTGNLWSAAGVRLATARFANETASGWQTVRFTRPVAVKAGATYVASYHVPYGRFAATLGGLKAPIARGDLRTPSNAGVYRYGATAFPSTSGSTSNYWADVLFTPATTGTLPGGVVPKPGEVGYRGLMSDLKVIDGTTPVPAGTRWTGSYLEVYGSAVTLDRVYVKGGVDFTATSGTLTVRNSVIEGGGAWFVLLGRRVGTRLDVRDSTLRWRAGSTPALGSGNGVIHGDSTLVAIRNDISGAPDGIQNGVGNSIIEQNYIHDLARLGTWPNNTHNDGIQLYDGSGINIRYNRIEIGFDGEHQNAAVFMQAKDGAIVSPQVIGNYLQGGGFTLRLEYATTGAVVRDNTFGPLEGGWGEAYARFGATIAEWTNNRRTDGTLVPKP